MILLTPYYLDSCPERQAELSFCLQQNLQNPLITKIILLLDHSLNSQEIKELCPLKIETILCTGRCTYQDCLDYANKYLKDEIVIIANTDIFFDNTLALLEEFDLSNKFINLLRWEVVEIDAHVVRSQLHVTIGSQDAWIFRVPLKPFVACFPLGKPGCDNRIAFEARTVGLKVINPAFSIRSHHLHFTNVRNYGSQDRIPGPYLLMPPGALVTDQSGEDLGYIYMRGDDKDDKALLNARAAQLTKRLPKTIDCQVPYNKSDGLVSPCKDPQSAARLTAVVISRNSEKTLDITLASLEGCYDQLIIINVNGTESVQTFSRRQDARIINAAEGQELQAMLSAIKGGWVFQLEADEFIDEQTRQFLKRFKDELATEQVRPDCYLVQRQWISPWSTTSYLVNKPHNYDLQLRLFRYSDKLSLVNQNSSFIRGFYELCPDLECVKIYSLYLTVNEQSVRQKRSLRSNWFEAQGETLRLCLPELQKMQIAPVDSQQFCPTVSHLLQSLKPIHLDQQLPLILPSEKADPVIVIDGVFFQYANSGIARVWETLLKEWVATGFAQHLVVIDRAGTAPKISGVTYRLTAFYDYSQHLTGREYNEQICQEEQASLFISTYYTTPLSCRSAFMAYDMIPEVQGWDLSTPIWQAKRQAIGHASAHIAISKNTAKDLTQLFPHINIPDVCVAYCGVDSHFQPVAPEQVAQFKMTWGITKPYVLIVGKRTQYKNILLFLLAFSQLPNWRESAIVCIGGGTLEEEFQIFARKFSIHMLNLSDQELATAYSGAVALIYPSVYEGFGMPVAEAMACGCPVITCNNSSLAEVAGEAALYVGETDVEGMINALQQVQQPAVRQVLAQAGLKQAKRFSWSRMAEDVAQALLKATLPIVPAPENHLLFPDWQQENIAEELAEVLSAWIAQYQSPQTALLISAEGFPSEGEMNIEAFLQGILTELFFTSGLVIENPIHFLPALYPAQWQLLLKEKCTYISMTLENRALVIETSAHQLPKLQLSTAQLIG
jgi:glycosyltransferase involved in cell wall biosynthesis